MRRIVLTASALCCLMFVLTACQTTNGGTGGYNIFYTPEDRVRELVAERKFDDAAAVYADQQAWFDAEAADPEVKSLLTGLAGDLGAKYASRLTERTAGVRTPAWPCPPEQWGKVKADLAALDGLIAEMSGVKLLSRPEYRPAALVEAERLSRERHSAMERGAAEAFARYPLATAGDFFADYPVAIAPGSFLPAQKTSWNAAAQKADEDGLRHLASVYGKVLPEEMQKDLGAAYFHLLCPSAGKADMADLLAAYAKVREAGLAIGPVPGVKVVFLDVTSDTLKRKGVIEFPVAVDLDLPLEASARKRFESKEVEAADIVILFNLAMTRTTRHMDASHYVKSTFVAGYREVPNPEWDVLQADLEQANTEYITKSASAGGYTGGGLNLGNFMTTDLWKVSEVDEAKAKLERLKAKLRRTPRFIKAPVYEQYAYQRVDLESVKTGSVQYYVIDKRKKRYYSDFFDIHSKEFFTVAYNVEDTDPTLATVRDTNVTEKEVDAFEKQAVKIKLSELLDHYAAHRGRARRYVSMADIRRDVLKHRNVAVADAEKEEYGFDKREDKRFESVVMVRNSKGLGSGFYVASDLVLTNYHVVEEQKFVELKKWDNTETFGKVLAKDVRMDLALVKVQDRGVPVMFYDRKDVSLGSVVEAIGHPIGIEFSLTRGVISSVRKAPSIMKVKGKPVLFIQTDTPINCGNSGGPLFLGRFVVGVNDWGFNKAIAEGLNFSIHYSEVFKFLDENHVAYRKGH